ncbi:MAG: hypothetical protein ABJF11_20515 [Reichenbachiella sp.]|uniref:HYC_CC_PP family protein n=1 Tax=Reichenbachiella sp. TaxID=2184521 RepID=UPI003265002A
MQKTTAIILSLFYLLIAADASVAIHKCMGSIESIDLVQTDKVCCCGDMNSDGCCENVMVDLPQDQEDKVISAYCFSFDLGVYQLIEVPPLLLLEKANTSHMIFGVGEDPPISSVPVYLEYCSFTFYG